MAPASAAKSRQSHIRRQVALCLSLSANRVRRERQTGIEAGSAYQTYPTHHYTPHLHWEAGVTRLTVLAALGRL
jgi:hypothetical protein